MTLGHGQSIGSMLAYISHLLFIYGIKWAFMHSVVFKPWHIHVEDEQWWNINL